MRIHRHPLLHFDREHPIHFHYNGRTIQAYEGETIAAALHAEHITTLSHSSRHARPRGFFCGIGKCSSCLMKVDGIPNVRTCITPVRDGMVVEDNDMEPPDMDYPPCTIRRIECDIAVVGGGPAGMSAALAASPYAKVALIDENHRLGGQLIKQTHKFFGSRHQRAGTRGIEIASQLAGEVMEKCTVLLNTTVLGYYDRGHHFLSAANKMEGIVYEISAKHIIFATGAQENMLVFEGNDMPGVYGAGGVQTLMNVYGIKPGDTGIIVGAGNVGLIVSYQLMQAGVNVACVVEALPAIGGYFVHAAKIRRLGIPILTRHTIKEAYGDGRVEGAVIARLDENWHIVEGSEQNIPCDFICLAVGLAPTVRLVAQTGAALTFVSEAGGWIALHNEHMETTREGIYVAGDVANIEEASTAMIEGSIAGLHAAHAVNPVEGFSQRMESLRDELAMFRKGYFGERPHRAKEKIHEGYYETVGTGRSD